jgi:hypothetical protein
MNTPRAMRFLTDTEPILKRYERQYQRLLIVCLFQFAMIVVLVALLGRYLISHGGTP